MNETYHVLIVEDDKDICDGIEVYLKNQGYIVHKAYNGQEGLNIVRTEKIHYDACDGWYHHADADAYGAFRFPCNHAYREIGGSG